MLSKRNELKIQESGPGELNIGCAERVVTSEKEIMDLVTEGNHLRKVAETNMNVQSSRSHTIFSIVSRYFAWNFMNAKDFRVSQFLFKIVVNPPGD